MIDLKRQLRRRLIRWGALLGVVVVLYVAVTFVQVWHASDGQSPADADAIVVLGAAQYDGEPSPVLRARLDLAHSLYEDGWATLIVTTGANQEGDRFTQGFAGYRYLRQLGVPDEDVIVIVDGTDTYEELAATARELDSRGLDRVLLVTDRYHAFRARHVASEVGLSARAVTTDGSASLRSLVRETAAVSVGRIVGYRRLHAWF